MAQPQTPPLLLTKRLTTFLTSRLSPSSTHTLLLTTPSGNLLAHASRPLKPASELRAQATVASSLVAMHTGCASLVPHALSASPADRDRGSDDDDDEGEEEEDGSDGGREGREEEEEEEAVAVTVQLAGGVVVIRRLRCGLLLVCVGPPGDEIVGLGSREDHHHHQQHAGGGGGGSVVGSPDEGDSVVSGGAASSVGSVGSVRAQGVLVVRKAAEEVARVLDERLGGLRVPLDTVGAD